MRTAADFLPLLHTKPHAAGFATQAAALCPASLSCAALRATLLVNLLVEESALSGSLGAGALERTHVPELPSGVSSQVAAWHSQSSEARCAAIRKEFKEAIAACAKTLSLEALTVEPVITINHGGAKTCDPCCLVRRRRGGARPCSATSARAFTL
jgi:hypothetical protein